MNSLNDSSTDGDISIAIDTALTRITGGSLVEIKPKFSADVMKTDNEILPCQPIPTLLSPRSRHEDQHKVTPHLDLFV